MLGPSILGTGSELDVKTVTYQLYKSATSFDIQCLKTYGSYSCYILFEFSSSLQPSRQVLVYFTPNERFSHD